MQATLTPDASETIGSEQTNDSAPQPLGNVFNGVLSAYYEQGFARGYRRAVGDLLSVLLVATDEHLSARETLTPAQRREIYEFTRFLQRRLQTLSQDPQYVSEGLGI